MKSLVMLAALALVMTATPGFAQAPAPTAPAAPQAPAAAQPAPQTPAPAPAATAQPPAPFPQGAKIAFVNLPGLFQLSRDGKAAAGRIQKATDDKQKQIEGKAKALQADRQKLETGGSVMTEAARGALQKEIDRQQREGERLEQDAQQELTELQQEEQAQFQRKLMPILDAVSKEKGLHMLFSVADSGLAWAEPGLDLTLEVVKRLDATPASAAAPPAKPAPPPPPATQK